LQRHRRTNTNCLEEIDRRLSFSGLQPTWEAIRQESKGFLEYFAATIDLGTLVCAFCKIVQEIFDRVVEINVSFQEGKESQYQILGSSIFPARFREHDYLTET